MHVTKYLCGFHACKEVRKWWWIFGVDGNRTQVSERSQLFLNCKAPSPALGRLLRLFSAKAFSNFHSSFFYLSITKQYISSTDNTNHQVKIIIKNSHPKPNQWSLSKVHIQKKDKQVLTHPSLYGATKMPDWQFFLKLSENVVLYSYCLNCRWV